MKLVNAELGATYFGIADTIVVGSEQWRHKDMMRVPVFVVFAQYGTDISVKIMPIDNTSGANFGISEITTIGFLTPGQVWKLTSA